MIRMIMFQVCIVNKCELASLNVSVAIWDWLNQPLPDLFKIGVWGACLHCVALQCNVCMYVGFLDNFFC